jgi:glycerate 2-kinase
VVIFYFHLKGVFQTKIFLINEPLSSLMSPRVIMNWKELSKGRPKSTAIKILEARLKAADPYEALMEALPNYFDQSFLSKRKIVIGFGKAAYGMALACERLLVDQISRGAIIVPEGTVYDSKLKKIKVFEGSHPVPTELNMKATENLLSLLQGLTDQDIVLCLISGGGSSLHLAKERHFAPR